MSDALPPFAVSQIANMTLARATLVGNIGLGHPVRLNALDYFRPNSIHSRFYRTSGNKSQRLSDNILNENTGMGNTFGERVKQARLAVKLSQQKLAKKAGVSQTTISDIERGRNDGSKDIVQIARALGQTPEYLLLGRGSEVAPPVSQITDEQAEILSIWADLIPSEREDVRRRAEHNREVLKINAARVVRVNDRRKAQTVYFGHEDRRKKDSG